MNSPPKPSRALEMTVSTSRRSARQMAGGRHRPFRLRPVRIRHERTYLASKSPPRSYKHTDICIESNCTTHSMHLNGFDLSSISATIYLTWIVNNQPEQNTLDWHVTESNIDFAHELAHIICCIVDLFSASRKQLNNGHHRLHSSDQHGMPTHL